MIYLMVMWFSGFVAESGIMHFSFGTRIGFCNTLFSCVLKGLHVRTSLTPYVPIARLAQGFLILL